MVVTKPGKQLVACSWVAKGYIFYNKVFVWFLFRRPQRTSYIIVIRKLTDDNVENRFKWILGEDMGTLKQ